MRLTELATVSNYECLNGVARWSCGRFSDSLFFSSLPFLSFHIDVQMACFGPSLNNSLAQKDVLSRTSHRVQL